MRGRWRNFENNQSEKAIKGNACNPKIGSITITLVLLTVIAFINYGCMHLEVHRKETPFDKYTRVASGPNTTKVRELTVSAQPMVHNPQVPVMLLYSERVTGPEEMVTRHEAREYWDGWNPLVLAFAPLYLIFLPVYYINRTNNEPVRVEAREWGCPDYPHMLLHSFIGYEQCAPMPAFTYRLVPDVEEIHQTDRTVEERHPLPQQSVQVKVAAQGGKWQKYRVLTVVTDADGQQRIPLDSVFKDFPNAPLEVTVIITADEAQTTVHLDSQVSEAIYTHVKK